MAKIIATAYVEATDLTVEALTAEIGMPPDRSFRIGDLRGKSKVVRDAHRWELRVLENSAEDPLRVGQTVGSVLRQLLDRLRNHSEGFRRAGTGRAAGLSIGISARAIPPLELAPDTLKEIAKLNSGCEIDLTLTE